MFLRTRDNDLCTIIIIDIKCHLINMKDIVYFAGSTYSNGIAKGDRLIMQTYTCNEKKQQHTLHVSPLLQLK